MTNVINRVVAGGLCTGCGLCASQFGNSRVIMYISHQGYLRPKVSGLLTKQEVKSFQKFCPGIVINFKTENREAHPVWGVITSCSTGWATDEEVRLRGSSGGAISGLLIHLIDSGQADFVAHIAADIEQPFRNRLRISRSRAEILSGAGSRYSPSAPLAQIEELFALPGRFAFVGKPCDVAAFRAHLEQHPDRKKKVVALLSFMCAGVPSELGTHEVLHKLGTTAKEVKKFNYRGNGWPGKVTAWTRDGRQLEMDYATSWGTVLNQHLQFRCKICPDGIGEFADIVGADAWYGENGFPDFEERAGRSLILARTQIGQSLLSSAKNSGDIISEPCQINNISLMQPYQENRKRLMISRLAALWLHRGNIPSFKGLRLWQAASGISLATQLGNFFGTLKRIPPKGSDRVIK